MTNQPFPKDEHKFDTLSLLAGLTEADTAGYSLDDILNEFGSKKGSGKPGMNVPKAPRQLEEERAVMNELEQLASQSAASKAVPAESVSAPAAPSRKPAEPVSPAAPMEAAAPVPPVKAASEEPEQEPSIIDQIQSAIDHDLELSMAAPEPVIHLDKEDPGVGDPALDAIFREKESRMPPPSAVVLPPDTQQDPSAHDGADEEARARRRARKNVPNLTVVEEQEPVPPMAEVYKKHARAIHASRLRLTVAIILTLVAVLWTAFNEFGWSEAALFASNKVASKVLLGVMVVCALVCFDVLLDGVKSMFSLKCTGQSMILLIFLVSAVDAVLCGDEQPLPFCAVVCLQFCFASWGSLLRNVGIRRALRPFMKLDRAPRGVSLVEEAWEYGDVAAVTEDGSGDEHVRCLYRTDAAEQRMRIYAPVSILLTLALAVLVRVQTGNSLTWSWSTMMICALPAASFVSYYRPFALLAARLMKSGVAVSGYAGAQRLAAADGITVTDTDLFPQGAVKINGMKVYGSYGVAQCVGYAAAVIEASGCGLTPLFQELRETNNGLQFPVHQFRRYESGGYGAEIGGDLVLVGSMRFMQLMGVPTGEKSRFRNALYLAVNGEMCAVFVLNYASAGKGRKALRQILEANGLSPVLATRDALITPLMVEERYKMPDANLDFPGAEERDQLSRLPGDYPALQGALLGKGGFNAYVDAVIGARLLRSVTSVSSIINLAGGFIGIVLMFLLTYLGAHSVITALNLLLVSLVWALPSLILAGWVARY